MLLLFSSELASIFCLFALSLIVVYPLSLIFFFFFFALELVSLNSYFITMHDLEIRKNNEHRKSLSVYNYCHYLSLIGNRFLAGVVAYTQETRFLSFFFFLPVIIFTIEIE